VDVVGVGIDLVEIDRMRTTLARTPGIVGRLFTEDEQAYCRRQKDPTERFAARFAAKEAVMKAMGVGIFDVAGREIEVVRAESGQPSVRLHGRATEIADRLGIRTWHLSMTHTDRAAESIALALGE
jgi:holo-[acyl-carrier protein] synthase